MNDEAVKDRRAIVNGAAQGIGFAARLLISAVL